MGQRIILSENEKLNIQKMYGLINEQDDSNKTIYVSNIPDEWAGKEYKASLSGDKLIVNVNENEKVYVKGVINGLRGVVNGKLTSGTVKDLYDKFGYMVNTIHEHMGMYPCKNNLNSPYYIFSSDGNPNFNRLIFPKYNIIFKGDIKKFEEEINNNKTKVKKIELTNTEHIKKWGKEHYFIPIDINYKDGDGFILAQKIGDCPRILEEGEYTIVE